MNITMQKTPKVIRVTSEEFELDDGRIFPHVIEFDEDEVPTVEEFQATYDRWKEIFANEIMD